MENYVTMDDSLVSREGVFVYSHALILSDGLPKFLTFVSTDNMEIYAHEDKIREFIDENISDDSIMVGCPHYRTQYSTLWEDYFDYEFNDKDAIRFAKKRINEAHSAAKNEATSVLEQMIKNTLDYESPSRKLYLL